MTTNKPNVNDDGRYELKAAAAALGVDRCTLLRYTHQGKIRSGFKRSNNRRFWTGAEILRFWAAEL